MSKYHNMNKYQIIRLQTTNYNSYYNAFNSVSKVIL